MRVSSDANRLELLASSREAPRDPQVSASGWGRGRNLTNDHHCPTTGRESMAYPPRDGSSCRSTPETTMGGGTLYRWILRGNIVVPSGNPFRARRSENEGAEEAAFPPLPSDTIIPLGPGLEIRLDHVVAVNCEGTIVRFEPAATFFEDGNDDDHGGETIHLDPRTEFLCPGFVDTHVHAPQFAFCGTGTDRPLMGPDGWLETYTFPTEMRFGEDPAFADTVYNHVVETTLSHGTTTALYYATLDLAPTKRLVDVCLERGQRALVGKVCMDRNAPPDYCHGTQTNLDETKELIAYVRKHPSNPHNLVLPVVTPRFIPTCTPELLTGLGELAARENCHVTSHISESLDEVEFSRALDKLDHPSHHEFRTDAEIFDSYGLLTDQCVMAHGVYLSNDDRKTLRDRGTAVAHCPLSNFFFAGGCCPCRELAREGNLVGLGTDVAGGYSPSMLHAARSAVLASRALQQEEDRSQEQRNRVPQQPPVQPTKHAIDYAEAFWLATLGGARALGLDDHIGTFRVGLDLDALVLSAKGLFLPPMQPSSSSAASNNVRSQHHHQHLADAFQKICNLGDDRNVTTVFVRGRKVVDKRRPTQ